MTNRPNPDDTARTGGKRSNVNVEFLFLDEDVCVPCGSTGKALEEAVDLMTEPLRKMGVDLDVTKVHVSDREKARAKRFVLSPTVRVNGKDIDEARTDDKCPSCGDIAGGESSVFCRTWHWHGEVYNAAPTGKIIEAVMSAALCGSGDCGDCHSQTVQEEGDFVLPENLERFFDARERNKVQGCCSISP